MFHNQLLRRFARTALLAAALPTAALAQQVTVQHAQGETTVPVKPELVFSFDYAAIDTLTALGIDVHGAPPLAGVQPDWLPGGLINIGSLFEPDYEEINFQQPDVILIGGRSAAAYGELSRMAPTVDLTFDQDFLASLQQNTHVLGQIFDVEDEAAAALGDLDERIAELHETVSTSGDGMLVMVSGGSLSVLAAQNARAGRGALLYQALGLQPTIEDVESATHGEPISFEFLLQYDPTWLFVIDRDAAVGTQDAQPAAAVLDNELMRQTTAWQEGNIVYLNPLNWYIITGAGLNSINEMLSEIEAAYSH